MSQLVDKQMCQSVSDGYFTSRILENAFVVTAASFWMMEISCFVHELGLVLVYGVSVILWSFIVFISNVLYSSAVWRMPIKVLFVYLYIYV